MRVAFVYNLRTKDNEDEAELLTPVIIESVVQALTSLGHTVAQVEASQKPNELVEKLLDAAPDLIFNAAEGRVGSSREAFYPGLYEQLGIPFTGAGPSLLHMNLDKHLAKTVIAAHGIDVPKGVLVLRKDQKLPTDLTFPLMIKPRLAVRYLPAAAYRRSSRRGTSRALPASVQRACADVPDSFDPETSARPFPIICGLRTMAFRSTGVRRLVQRTCFSGFNRPAHQLTSYASP